VPDVLSSYDLPASERLRDVRWIAFDAVGTLIYPDPPVREIYHRVGLRHGSQLTQDEISARFATAFRASEAGSIDDADGDGAAAQTSEPIERERWLGIVSRVIDDAHNPRACFEELFAHFAQPTAWKCYREVSEVLLTLQQVGYRLALASNFDDRLTAIRRGLPELAPIDACVVSSLVGFRKPSRRFYDALIRATDASAEQILMIGDDPDNDVRGAHAAGLPALLIDRDGAAGGLTSLTELYALLELELR
jgi:putative hydrolase of the HAD superfamily